MADDTVVETREDEGGSRREGDAHGRIEPVALEMLDSVEVTARTRSTQVISVLSPATSPTSSAQRQQPTGSDLLGEFLLKSKSKKTSGRKGRDGAFMRGSGGKSRRRMGGADDDDSLFSF